MNFRATMVMLNVAALATVPAPAMAQQRDGALRSQLRTCSQIAEVSSRVACYDALSADVGEAAPGERASTEPSGLGSEQVRQVQPARAERASEQAEPESIEATVTAAVQREPGIHLLTLEDGAQWQFAEGVSPSYNPPRRGSTVEIRRAAMGSYLMRFQGQQAVRVRRIR